MNPSLKESHGNVALYPPYGVLLSSLIVFFSLRSSDHPCYFIPFLCHVDRFRFLLAWSIDKTIKKQQSKWGPLVKGKHTHFLWNYHLVHWNNLWLSRTRFSCPELYFKCSYLQIRCCQNKKKFLVKLKQNCSISPLKRFFPCSGPWPSLLECLWVWPLVFSETLKIILVKI